MIQDKRKIKVGHSACSRLLPTAIACVAIAALAQPTSADTQATATARFSQGSQPPFTPTVTGPSGTQATVACKRLHANHIRCTMTINGGAGISGRVRMRITRGKVVVALGIGRLRRGTATLTMRALHRMTPGRYTVAMVVTLNATTVLRLP
jgi:hypothetical protein